MLSYQAQEGTDRGSGLCHPQGPPQQPAPSCPRDTPSLAPPSSLQAHPTRSLPALLRQGATPAVGLETAFNGALGAICLAPLLPSHLPTLVPPRASSTPPHPCRCGGHPRALRLLATRLPQSDEGEGGGAGLGVCGRSRCQQPPGCGPGLQVALLEQGGLDQVGPCQSQPVCDSGTGVPNPLTGMGSCQCAAAGCPKPRGPCAGWLHCQLVPAAGVSAGVMWGCDVTEVMSLRCPHPQVYDLAAASL